MDERLVVLISALARSAPAPLVKSLAERLSRLDWRQAEHARHTLLAAIPQPAIRTLVQQLLLTWQTSTPTLNPQSLSSALMAAAQTSHADRTQQEVNLVWTGPTADGPPLRRTDQALIQIIEGAQRSLLIVSFAVYSIPAIRSALIDAAARHVQISFLSNHRKRAGAG